RSRFMTSLRCLYKIKTGENTKPDPWAASEVCTFCRDKTLYFSSVRQYICTDGLENRVQEENDYGEIDPLIKTTASPGHADRHTPAAPGGHLQSPACCRFWLDYCGRLTQ